MRGKFVLTVGVLMLAVSVWEVASAEDTDAQPWIDCSMDLGVWLTQLGPTGNPYVQLGRGYFGGVGYYATEATWVQTVPATKHEPEQGYFTISAAAYHADRQSCQYELDQYAKSGQRCPLRMGGRRASGGVTYALTSSPS